MKFGKLMAKKLVLEISDDDLDDLVGMFQRLLDNVESIAHILEENPNVERCTSADKLSRNKRKKTTSG